MTTGIAIRIVGYLGLILLLSACGSGGGSADAAPELELLSSEAPLTLPDTDIRFVENVAYGEDAKQTFDIFLPDSDEPTALIIYIHGGGFTGGDKANIYALESNRQQITDTLAAGVAYATVNYRLLQEVDAEGVIKPLSDTKRALQFIRYYAKSFNIKKEEIALYGASAGAGASLWLGLSDEMADRGATRDDDIDDESTRVKAVGAIETQGSYDLVKWETDILDDVGVTLAIAAQLGLEQRLLSFYGIDEIEQIYDDPIIIAYRAAVDLLALMSPDDPELWIRNSHILDGAPLPTDDYDVVNALFHHPRHAKALMDQADFVGIPNVTYIPNMGIEHPGGEQVIAFLLRHLAY